MIGLYDKIILFERFLSIFLTRHFSEPLRLPSISRKLIIVAITVLRLDKCQQNQTQYAINIRKKKLFFL